MELTSDDLALIEKAKELCHEKKIYMGVVKEAGSALITEKGVIFTGASLDIWCGIGFCAEHSAIANMISHSDETRIKTIVAYGEDRLLYPCGRCREFINAVDKWNRENTDIIISENEKIKLKKLLPYGDS